MPSIPLDGLVPAESVPMSSAVRITFFGIIYSDGTELPLHARADAVSPSPDLLFITRVAALSGNASTSYGPPVFAKSARLSFPPVICKKESPTVAAAFKNPIIFDSPKENIKLFKDAVLKF